MKNDQRLTNE